MKMKHDCIPCIYRQTLEGARMATDEETVIREILNKYAALIPELDMDQTSPELVAEVREIIKEKTGETDPYQEFKKENMELALTHYPKAKKIVEKSEDLLFSSLIMSAVGNSIDAGISLEVKLEENLKQALAEGLVRSDYDQFKKRLKMSQQLLIVADNAGEAVFDKLLIKELKKYGVDIYYAVREKPVLNDITLKEAKQLNLNQDCHLISSGSTAPGMTMKQANQEFKQVFKQSDLIISKGQGNLEGLSETEEEIFFLLKAKCELVADLVQVNVGDLVFVLKEEGQQGKL